MGSIGSEYIFSVSYFFFLFPFHLHIGKKNQMECMKNEDDWKDLLEKLISYTIYM